jgi:hypothetical protein
MSGRGTSAIKAWNAYLLGLLQERVLAGLLAADAVSQHAGVHVEARMPGAGSPPASACAAALTSLGVDWLELRWLSGCLGCSVMRQSALGHVACAWAPHTHMSVSCSRVLKLTCSCAAPMCINDFYGYDCGM